MLIGVFKSNQKILGVGVVLLTALFWLPSFFIEPEAEIVNAVLTGFRWLDLFISIVLISAQAVYLNIIVNEYKLVDDNTHLTSLVFVILNSSFLMLFNLNQVLIANTFVLFGMHQLLKLYDTRGGFALVFNAGFLMSMATVIYFPNAIFLLLLFVGLLYMFSPKWRDFLIALIGFSIPVIYMVSYHFVFGDGSSFELKDYVIKVFNIEWSNLTSFGRTLCFIILGLVLLAFMRVSTNMNRGGLRARKMLVVIFLMSFFGLGSLFFNGLDSLATFVVLTIPLSIIVANFFQSIKKKWLAELVFTVLLTGVIANYFL